MIILYNDSIQKILIRSLKCQTFVRFVFVKNFKKKIQSSLKHNPSTEFMKSFMEFEDEER